MGAYYGQKQFGVLMTVGWFIGQLSSGPDDGVLEGLMIYLRHEVTYAFRELKAGDRTSMVVRLRDALTHEDLIASAIPSDLFDDLSQAEAAALLEQLSSAEAWARGDERLRPLTTRLALRLDLDVLARTARSVVLWPKLDAVHLTSRFLAEQCCSEPFADVAVHALLQDAPGTDKRHLLDRCLDMCKIHCRFSVAQVIRGALLDVGACNHRRSCSQTALISARIS